MSVKVYPFEACGREYEFRVVSGAVLGTDQRSDTRVWGGGSTMVMNGTGGGSTTIKSRVDVVRDLWLKDREGQEHHFRFHEDIPFREGQEVHCIHLVGKSLDKKQSFSAVYSVYNASVDRYWGVGDVNAMINMPRSISWFGWFFPLFVAIVGALTGVAGFAVFTWGMALLWLLFLGIRKVIFRDISARRALGIQRETLAKMEEVHRQLIGEIHQTRLQQPEPVASLT